MNLLGRGARRREGEYSPQGDFGVHNRSGRGPLDAREIQTAVCVQRDHWRELRSKDEDVPRSGWALKMDVTDLMRQCNGKVSPSKALVKGLSKELDIDESYLNRLADEVRKDLG
jgi:hypothetical protein